MPPSLAPGILDGDLDGLVEVLALDEEVPRQLLLGLGEGAVGGQHLGVAHPDRGGVGRRTKALAALQDAPLGHRLHPLGVFLVHLGGVRARRWACVLLEGNQQQVAHGGSPLLGGWGWFRSYDDRVGPGSTPSRGNLDQLRRRTLAMMTTSGSDDLLELEVGALAGGGGCVARAPDGKVVFVRHSLPGERVRARITAATRSYLRADAVQILNPSPDRVVPPCPHAGPGRCGGCDFQHVEIGAQRRLKAARVQELLRSIARVEREIEVEGVAGAEGGGGGLGWRTRVRLAVDRSGTAGFRRHRSHRVEPIEHCPVTTAAIAATGALAVAWPGATEVEVITGATPGEAVVSVTPGRHGAPKLSSVHGGLVVRGKVRRDPGAVHRGVGDRTYRVSSGVFWQAHVGAADALLAAVLDVIGECEGAAAVDLYAGAGLFSVALADAVGSDGSVVAVEREQARLRGRAAQRGWPRPPAGRGNRGDSRTGCDGGRPPVCRGPRPRPRRRGNRRDACAHDARPDPATARLRLM